MYFINIVTRKGTLAQRLVLGIVLSTTLSLPSLAQRNQNQQQQDGGGQSSFQARQDIRRAQQVQQPVQPQNSPERSERHFRQRIEQSNRRAEQAQQRAITEAREQAEARARAEARAQSQARAQAERDRRAAANAARISNYDSTRRPTYRTSTSARNWRNYGWNNNMDNRRRYQAYRQYRNNWKQQRAYLHNNLARFNQLALMNQLQQQQLDSQMRAAWLAYHNNQWNGPYNWNNYSDPRFLDYLQTSRPSLLQTILSYLGLGSNDNYLYSSDWDVERDELAYNMARIHQLAVEGRITRAQEQMLMDQLRAEFVAYHNNTWSGPVNWSQYSDPNFVDYLNNSRPSLLSTVRDLLVR
jgi:hypothetical protein